jgi:transposase
MGTARYVQLSEVEDAGLRELELSRGIHHKVRLRASILRLSNQRWTVTRLHSHFGRSIKAIHNDFDRWQERGVEGLADGAAPGNPSKITAEMESYLAERLKEERGWDCSQLSEALWEKYRVEVKRETIRVKLIELGYSWQRSRYDSGKEPNAQEVQQAHDNIDTLKRGHWKIDLA